MNKTTEALKLAEEALQDCMEKFYAMKSTGVIGALPSQAVKAAATLAAIREALAEHQDKPAECANGCPENTVCDYCQRAEPVKHSEEYWLHEINQKYAEGYEQGRASCKHDERMKELAEPVKQKPVAWALMHKNGLELNSGYGVRETLQEAEDMQRRHLGNLQIVPLYTTPPTAAKAARDMRDAAVKVCRGQLRNTSYLASNPPQSAAAWDAANLIAALPVPEVQWRNLTPQEVTDAIREGAADGGWQGFATRVMEKFKEVNGL